jgi:hypothetical protein
MDLIFIVAIIIVIMDSFESSLKIHILAQTFSLLNIDLYSLFFNKEIKFS